MRLSIVIPAYNEAGRIVDTLAQVSAYLKAQPYDWEVIVVDDGSADDTVRAVERAAPYVRVISYTPNRGKGFAVKTGMTAAVGAYRVFYDADASTPIDQVEKLWPEFDRGADVVIGSRSMAGSDVRVHQAWYRENMGRVFNVALRVLGLTHFPDTQCGFKGFTARACEIVFPRQTIEGFSFDVELLYIARIQGLRVAQVPVVWINSPRTTLNAVSDSTRMFFEVLQLRWRAIRGKYR